MLDFTEKTYLSLLNTLLRRGFVFQTLEDFLANPREKVIILRHDVDRLPQNSLRTAEIEHKLGIHGTYYFRIVPQSNRPEIIRRIAALGHEIGYHYEDMSLVSETNCRTAASAFCRFTRLHKHPPQKELNPPLTNYQSPITNHQSPVPTPSSPGPHTSLAILSFEQNLSYFRQFYPVRTICMHGSPLSRYDSRDLWKYYNYRDYGITGEPYFDIDFTRVLYLTDTGRRWDGEKVSIRDKVTGNSLSSRYFFRSTFDIIQAANANLLPNQIMITVHPQRWSNNFLSWTKELVLQNAKNRVKGFMVKRKG